MIFRLALVMAKESAAPSTTHATPTHTHGARSKMQIFVKTVEGKTVTLSGLSTGGTVAGLKAMVCDREGIPACQQRLLFGGTLLQDGRTLQESGVEQDSTVHMVLGLCGGACSRCTGSGHSKSECASNKRSAREQKYLCHNCDGWGHEQSECTSPGGGEHAEPEECTECYSPPSRRCEYGQCRSCCGKTGGCSSCPDKTPKVWEFKKGDTVLSYILWDNDDSEGREEKSAIRVECKVLKNGPDGDGEVKIKYIGASGKPRGNYNTTQYVCASWVQHR